MSHIIRHLGFGPHYPGQSNPLDGYVRIVDGRPHSYKYFLKVVPTEYYGRLGESHGTLLPCGWQVDDMCTQPSDARVAVTEMYQYSVTECPLPPRGLPFPSPEPVSRRTF